MKGRLVVIEGPDGVGKTTIARALVDRIRGRGEEAEYASFPGNIPGTLGEWVYLNHHNGISVAPDALQVAHVAAHIDSIRRLIVPALELGKIVVLDRYWWSTWIYGEVTGCTMQVIKAAISAELSAWGDVRPYAIFLIDRELPFREEHNSEKFAALRKSYNHLAAREPGGVRLVPNEASLAEVVEGLLTAVLPKPHSEATSNSVKTAKRRRVNPDQQALELNLEGSKTVDSMPYVYTRLAPARPTEVYATYWRFAAERQNIFHRRAIGQSRPWTTDPILGSYRFTNAYRAADRVSQYLIRHVIYSGDMRPENVVFRTLLFKMFNRIGTWEHLTASVGTPTWADFNRQDYESILSNLMDQGEKVFSNAYIMPTRAPGFTEPRKHSTFLLLLEHIMKDGLSSKLQAAEGLREVFTILRAYPLLGDFLAFQYTIDLNYSEVIGFDEMDFVVAGPGAKSGLRKCFSSPGDFTESELILLVAENQEEEFERRGLKFNNLWGRRLHLVDCQNLFCEVDKYARVAHPSSQGIGGRTRIKQAYAPQRGRLDYWFPPKWNINERIKSHGNQTV